MKALVKTVNIENLIDKLYTSNTLNVDNLYLDESVCPPINVPLTYDESILNDNYNQITKGLAFKFTLYLDLETMGQFNNLITSDITVLEYGDYQISGETISRLDELRNLNGGVTVSLNKNLEGVFFDGVISKSNSLIEYVFGGQLSGNTYVENTGIIYQDILNENKTIFKYFPSFNRNDENGYFFRNNFFLDRSLKFNNELNISRGSFYSPFEMYGIFSGVNTITDLENINESLIKINKIP